MGRQLDSYAQAIGLATDALRMAQATLGAAEVAAHPCSCADEADFFWRIIDWGTNRPSLAEHRRDFLEPFKIKATAAAGALAQRQGQLVGTLERVGKATIPGGRALADATTSSVAKSVSGLQGVLLDRAKAAIWGMHNFVRGPLIEKVVALTDYKGWQHVGQLKNGFYEMIDFEAKGAKVVSQFKSFNGAVAGAAGESNLNGLKAVLGRLEASAKARPTRNTFSISAPRRSSKRRRSERLSGRASTLL